MIWNGIMDVYAVIAIFSFLLFPLLWVISYVKTGNKNKSSRLAADITMIFLIGAVAALYDNLFHTGFQGIWIIVLFLLLLAGFIGNVQNRIKGRVDPMKISRAVWRLGFIVLSIMYIIFFMIGIIKNLFGE